MTKPLLLPILPAVNTKTQHSF